MPDLKLLPISRTDLDHLDPLMSEEERAWMNELAWDYSPVRRILVSFIRQRLLPGFVAFLEDSAVAYAYFLSHQHKGIIGAIYAYQPYCTQETASQIINQVVEALKGSDAIRRIEAQVIPFHGLDLKAGFAMNGFRQYDRYFLELDLTSYAPPPEYRSTEENILPWQSDLLPGAAEITLQSYRKQADAEICEDYASLTGCSAYLHSLVENPGCGFFLPQASFMGLDGQGLPCGFVIASRISELAGMIPQIAITPAHQGRGLGRALMEMALSRFKALGFRSAGLTVTKTNHRAFEWYQRLGFKIRKEFGAFIWESTS